MTPIEKFMTTYNQSRPLLEQVLAAIADAVAEEREACAKIAEKVENEYGDSMTPDWYCASSCIAEKIRQRKGRNSPVA